MSTTSPTLKEPQLTIVILAFFISSGLALLGSLFTSITFLAFKGARNSATYLIFCLALSDLVNAISSNFLWVFLIEQESNVYCKIQGGMQMFGLCASLMWGLNIGFYIFLALYKNVELDKLADSRKWFHVFAWGYAIVGTAIPFVFDQYSIIFPQNKYSWCWIGNTKSLFRLILYVPDAFIFVALAILYIVIQRRLRQSNNSAAKVICKKMNIYLLTYTLINVFAFTNRIQNLISSHSVFELYLLQFMTQPLQGFMNAFAYISNEPEYIEHYKQLFRRITGNSISTNLEAQERERLRSLVNYDGYGSAKNILIDTKVVVAHNDPFACGSINREY